VTFGKVPPQVRGELLVFVRDGEVHGLADPLASGPSAETASLDGPEQVGRLDR
jgi:hypothetical protein